jgi:hypothetical protein
VGSDCDLSRATLMYRKRQRKSSNGSRRNQDDWGPIPRAVRVCAGQSTHRQQRSKMPDREGTRAACPEVAGSNPAPATKRNTRSEAVFGEIRQPPLFHLSAACQRLHASDVRGRKHPLTEWIQCMPVRTGTCLHCHGVEPRRPRGNGDGTPLLPLAGRPVSVKPSRSCSTSSTAVVGSPRRAAFIASSGKSQV